MEKGRNNYADFLNVTEIIALRGTHTENLVFAHFIAGEWVKKLLVEENTEVLEQMETQREVCKGFILNDRFAVLTYLRSVDINAVTSLEREMLLDVIPLFAKDNQFVAELKEQLEAIGEEELFAREA